MMLTISIFLSLGGIVRWWLSAPHFGPPASHVRIPDRSPGHYSSPGNQRAPGVRSTDKGTAPQNGPTDTQGPSRSGNKLQMTILNSTRLPEGRFSNHGRLPASLQGTSTKNRDHDGPRAPHNEPRTSQNIQGTLRKSQSQVPRPSRANGPRPRTTSQRSLMGAKGSPR
ncbi:hypothetical protein CRG98_021100 [Punica granatum]|uniref:Uncharacterized protein n=1 Tax=Punica granatum TaxID=22663 RepID=A0A2I0JQC4_PUNGR|nr:hypothetical protein CRG98_021100 [Punica granatum]